MSKSAPAPSAPLKEGVARAETFLPDVPQEALQELDQLLTQEEEGLARDGPEPEVTGGAGRPLGSGGSGVERDAAGDTVSEAELDAAAEGFPLPADWPCLPELGGGVEVRGAEDELLREGVGPGQYDADWARLERRAAGKPCPITEGKLRAGGAGEQGKAARRKRKRTEAVGGLPDSGSNESSRTNGDVLCGEPGYLQSTEFGGETLSPAPPRARGAAGSKALDPPAPAPMVGPLRTVDVPQGMQSVGVDIPAASIAMEVVPQGSMRSVTFFIPGDKGRARNERSISMKKGRRSVILPVPFGAKAVKLCRLPKGTEQVAYRVHQPADEWLCCDKCEKWRRVPGAQHRYIAARNGRSWNCAMNLACPDASCKDVEEEWEDEGWTYVGTPTASLGGAALGPQGLGRKGRHRMPARAAKHEFKKQLADIVLPILDDVLQSQVLQDDAKQLLEAEQLRGGAEGGATAPRVVREAETMRAAVAHREVESCEHMSAQLKKVLVETADILPKGADIRKRLLALKSRLERDWRKIQPQLATLAKSLMACSSLNKNPESQGALDSRSTDSRQSGSSAFGLNNKDEKPWAKFNLEEDKAKFKLGSVKASIFHVLLEAGPKGLSVSQIVATTQALGLKDWTGVATPKCTVSAACSTDPIFVRVAPGTFALRAIPGVIEVPPLSHHSRNASRKKTVRQKAAAAAAAAAATTAQQKARESDTGSSKRAKTGRGVRPGNALELPDDATNWDLVDLEQTAGLIGGGDLPTGDHMPTIFGGRTDVVLM